MKWYPSNSSSCVSQNTAGFPYEELTCLYPLLGKTHTVWEMTYDPVHVRDWMVNTSLWFPILACVLYGALIVAGQYYFATRPAWNCRPLLAVWNLGLSLFSLVGLVRVLPALVHQYVHYSWQENFCFDPESHFGSGTTGIWVQLFILSKFPELFDTFFIVVHKKKLIFLHWYHHISVLLYCWHSYVTKAPPGIIFCAMNFGVHGLMYFYYFLMAIKAKPKWLNASWITVAQISQMVVGVAVTVLGFVVHRQHPDTCWVTADNNLAALIMYGSYLVLFVQFFVQRYLSQKKVKRQQLKAKGGGGNIAATTNGKAIRAQNGHHAPTAQKKRRKED